jgi:hypothetical protein
MGDRAPESKGQLGYLDYVKAAFNVRPHIPGLGHVPVNWLYLAAIGVAGIAFPPLWLIGAAGELALLAGLSNNARFQNAVRARRRLLHGALEEEQIESLIQSLSGGYRHKYERFRERCAEVLQIVKRVGHMSDADYETYQKHLADLREVYAKMLGMLDMLAIYSRDWEKTDPTPQMKDIQAELDANGLPPGVRKSREATLDVLERRAESRAAISARAHVVNSELARLEEQVALLRDQALLTRDPAVLSESMDATAEILEEHTSWLQENMGLMEGLEEMTAGE